MVESFWNVEIRNNAIVCTSPQGDVDIMPIASITSVKIETNDEGPLGTDVWWIIGSAVDALVFPSGATGEQQILQVLQQLPGFNNSAVVDAMICVEPKTFVCL